MLTVLVVPKVSAQIRGPNMDTLRFTVIKSPDAQLLSMLRHDTHVLPSLSVPMDLWSSLLGEANGGLIRTADIGPLEMEGFTITSNPGFHIGHIAYNIRPDQSYRRLDVTFWPLADVEFRHALIHGYNQTGIIPDIYDYIATPTRSLVPPAQGDWYNPAVPEHPFNLGDPFTSPPGEHSTCGILLGAGYTFVDADVSGTVTDDDYWNMPNSDPLPRMVIWTPLLEVAPTSWEHGQRFVEDLGTVGLAATTANGECGLVSEGADFNWYLEQVLYYSDFDGYMGFWGVGRFPEQLYLLLHSSQDSLSTPGAHNAPGVSDVDLDGLLETMKFTLAPAPGQPDPRRDAAFEVQNRVYNETYDYALAYMVLYSRTYFNAYNPDLRGVVKSSGYGSDNKWTFLNIHWEPGTERIEDGRTFASWTLGEDPDSLNPLYAYTKYEWEIIARVYDGLTMVNPYDHKDIPWIATEWSVVETPTGMNVTYYLRDDVYWQDGYPYTAMDAEFSLEFIRDWQIPRYTEAWQNIIDVEVVNSTTFTVQADETSQFLIYDWAALAAMLPPQVWDRTWFSLDDILYFPCWEIPYTAENLAPGYSPGPWADQVPTLLFGTGPWIFQFYDPVGMYSDLWANRNYLMTQEQVNDLKTEMFWEVGDVNRDGIINVIDMTQMSLKYGFIEGEPGYDPDCDLDQDGDIDIYDILANGGGVVVHLLWQRTYPDGGGGGSGVSSSQFIIGESVISESQQASEPAMYVDPPEIVNYTLKTNDLFSVNITIANVTDLMGYDFKLTFDSTILDIVSVNPGDFFGADPEIWHNNTNNAEGFVRFAMTPQAGTQNGEGGSGRLTTIEFCVKEYGNSSIELKGYTKLANSRGIQVDHTTLDGYFDNRHPGDINEDETINVLDLTLISFSFGYYQGEPEYNPDADINEDGVVDTRDLAFAALNLGWTWDP